MAYQISPTTAPLAPPPQIKWRSHVPNASADPRTRIRCALIDLLSSNTIETLPHSPGPYFSSAAFKRCFETRYDISGEIIMATDDDDGVTCHIVGMPLFEWLAPSEAQDAFQSLSWHCVVAILAHERSAHSRRNGSQATDQEYRLRMQRDWNPLRHLGYLGRPGLLVDGQLVNFFRRIQ